MKKREDNLDSKFDDLESRLYLHKKIFIFLQSSIMSPEEKSMWIMTLPYMSDRDILKLKNILESECNDIADLHIKALNKNISN